MKKGCRRGPSHKTAVEATRFYIELLHGQVWLTGQSVKVRGSSGIPNMLAVLGSRRFFIETKFGRNKLTPQQAIFKAQWESRGVPVVVGGLDEVKAFIEATANGNR
jgi:hypothetical protein